mgnify:CR=1 FL=1
MILAKFESVSLGAAAKATRSPAGWLAAAAFVALDVAALCGVSALELPVIVVGVCVPSWLAWCWLSAAARAAR